ncbi:MAG: selenocysteine lyase [Ignavibacteria bacterium GWA2_55_11]|nr:MAG: selenocysteine lyase [Ignavibacteria bacterium GWA2_55_11]OGU75199.1 MAG: selenocysteine lyase [Ignavibacteria bacterium RIFCSPLOWO2_02_FULL_55_14]
MIPQAKQTTLDDHFSRFRRNIVGIGQTFETPHGKRPILYVDWTASGRLYDPIERKMLERFGPFVGNTHSESNVTGTSMTQAYHMAHDIIKRHVHAGPNDVLLNVGFGMTAAVNKLQRILGLRLPEQLRDRVTFTDNDRPVVFVTHMEHHSNHTSWEETIADVVVIRPDAEGLVDVENLSEQLHLHRNRTWKIGSFTACSNVTGIKTPLHTLARIMHENGGWAFVDFACSAPYTAIDMHPADPLEKLDAITFSPHKFLGGPGTSGVLVFDAALYHLQSPDQPGGGTVLWTNPWGGHRYSPDIEVREDGGTPGFLQAIKAALCVKLKEEMDPALMHAREEQLVQHMFAELTKISGLHILADSVRERQPLFSFYIDGIHYNLIVRLLNDRFGIQVRGGCSCAGTYGHYLLHVDKAMSQEITNKIDHGDLSSKPGWVRISLHPTTTDEEVDRIIDALRDIRKHHASWEKDYEYSVTTNEYVHRASGDALRKSVASWFE